MNARLMVILLTGAVLLLGHPQLNSQVVDLSTHLEEGGYKQRSERWLQTAEEGQKALQRNQFDQAIKLLTAALQMDPDRVNAAIMYFLRASAYLEKRDLTNAMADAESALRSDSRNAQAWVTRGRVYFAQGKIDAGTADFAKAEKLAPRDPYVVKAMAWLKQAKGSSPQKGKKGR